MSAVRGGDPGEEALPSVTLILLNWNGRAWLEQSVPSLLDQAYPAFKLVVVDNASTDDSVDFLYETYPQARVLARPRNDGFAAGNNAALRALDSDVAVLVNPDVVAAPDWLATFMAALAAAPDVGVAGCRLLYRDGRLQHAGGLITRPQGLADHHGHGAADDAAFRERRDVDYVIGAAMAIRAEVLARIGLFDEDYFLYFEDADFCARARRGGAGVAYLPEASLVHHESALTGAGTLGYLRHMHVGRWRYLLKHFAPEDILAETAPAERAWLATTSDADRRAAARAYLRSWGGLAGILAARVRDGGTAVDDGVAAALADLLAELLGQAWDYASPAEAPGAAALASRAMVRPRPFHSDKPLVGPLIGRLRSLWARLDTRPFVEPFTAGQNTFNKLVTTQAAHYETALAEHRAALADVEAALRPHLATGGVRGVGEALSELAAELALAEARLADLETRLAALGDARSRAGSDRS